MSQTIGSIRVKTYSLPSANATTGAVRISVNPGGTQQEFSVSSALDVVFENTANNNSVLTYDNTTNKFVVQNVPRLNGGTF